MSAVVDSRRLPGLTLFVIASCETILLLDGMIVNIALPAVQNGLRMSPTDLSWVVNAFALVFGGLLLFGSRAGDVLGRRRVFTVGIALFTVASLGGGFATSATHLLVVRALQGLGAALAAPNTLALLMTNFEDGEKRNRALAVYSTIAGSGMALGLVVGGLLTELGTWRLVFFVNVPIGLLIILLTPLSVNEAERHTGRFDVLGTLTSTLGMTSLVYALIRVSGGDWDDGVAIACFVLGALLLAAFVAVETRTPQPMVPFRLFRDRSRASAFADMLLVPATLIGMFFFLTQFLQEVLRFGPVQAGLAFLPVAVALFASAKACVRLLPRVGARSLALTGVGAVAVAITWLSLLSADSGYLTGVLGPLVLFGLGIGLSVVPLNVVIVSGIDPADSGAVSGVLQASQQLGGSLGLAVLVTVFGNATRGAGQVRLPHETLVYGIGTAYRVGALFTLLALLVTAIGVRPPKPSAVVTEQV